MNQEGDKKKKTEQKIPRKEAAEEKNKLNAPVLVHKKNQHWTGLQGGKDNTPGKQYRKNLFPLRQK